MTALIDRLGLGSRDLVAVVGAGGKSTVLLTLGRELAAAEFRVVLTTSTKMGLDQLEGAGTVLWSPTSYEVEVALDGPGPVMVFGGSDGHKVVGPPLASIDALYAETAVDYLVVEADGARRRPFKAPAAHEPVIPAATTLVVVVAGMDGLGRPVGETVHRPQRVEALTGLGRTDLLTVDAMIGVLGHPEGGLARVPADARVVVAVTKVTPATEEAALQIAGSLERERRIDRVVLLAYEE